jgi:YD repeat-containing protein
LSSPETAYSFQYDAMGNPLRRETGGQVHTYSFNNLNQFTSAPATVDELGNWVRHNVPLVTGENAIAILVTDKYQRTVGDTRNVTLAAAPVFAYDANGNTTGDGTWTYTWNQENRLVEAELSGMGVPPMSWRKVQYSYDAPLMVSDLSDLSDPSDFPTYDGIPLRSASYAGQRRVGTGYFWQ